MLKSVSLEQALELLKKYSSSPTGVEEISLMDSFERILAEHVVAGFPLPPFNRSLMDGYALRSEDTLQATKERPVVLQITQTLYAGDASTETLLPGEAAGVTTGTLLPQGSDAVVKYEDITRAGDKIFLPFPLKKQENIDSAGAYIARGEKVLEPGTNITPAVLGLLASLGMGTVKVYKKPTVAIFSLGDELLEVGQSLTPGKIYNSNLYSLAAQVKEAGGAAHPRGKVLDNMAAISQAINSSLEDYDMVITSGGASVGAKDLIKDAIALSGANTLISKVGMKPGTPVVCGEKEGKLIMGLSGNPVAAMMIFILLVRPVLRRMAGKQFDTLTEVNAVMDTAYKKSSTQRRLLRAVISWKNGVYYAVPAETQGPGAVKSILHFNALVDIPAGFGPLKAGDKVRALLLPPPYCM